MLKIIISPAKKMNIIDEFDCTITTPIFLNEAKQLHEQLITMPLEALKSLWQCSDKLTVQNYERLHTYTMERNLTPALLAYEGIQYQYMAPQIFDDMQWNYVCKHLRILSGFYGILKPTDGVIPYRLEMQAKLKNANTQNLYQFWGDVIYRELIKENKSCVIVNLASAEYSKAVLPYVESPISYITCVFGEMMNGKVKVKGTQAKMARGEMVRWMAKKQVENVTDIQNFNSLGYQFQEELSTDTEYVFIKTSPEF